LAVARVKALIDDPDASITWASLEARFWIILVVF
jgi:hypothetical protein